MSLQTGVFVVDEAQVTGNSTLFEGTTVETNGTASQLRLNDGVRMRLASSSKGTVYRDRLVLEQGAGQMENSSNYGIEAMGLMVIADGSESAARVELKDQNLVHVAALRGNFRITNADGFMLASLSAGKALEFDPVRAGASAPSNMSGCLREQDGHYLLTDETAGVTVELRGSGLASKAGNRIGITGVVVPSVEAASGATQVIQVSSLNQISTGCASAAAAPAGGMSGKKKSVIAGVVVAAAASGAAVGLTRGEDTPTTISR